MWNEDEEKKTDFEIPDIESLTRATDDARAKKGNINLVGAIGDILSNRQGFGNFYSGKMAPKSDAASRFAQAAAEGVADPMQEFKRKYEAVQASRQMQAEASDRDPNSKSSMALKALAPRWGIKVTPEMSAYDIKQMIDPKRMMETEAQTNRNFENQKILHEMDNKARAQDRAEARQARSQDLAEARAARAEEKSMKQKELSATQAKQRGLYEVGRTAEDQYNNAVKDKDNYDPTSVGQVIDNSEWAPNWMRNNKAIEAKAAQSAWVEAFLRDASGAAIPPSERMAYAKDFFPQPGDSDDVVANKAMLRKQKMENARIAAGIETGHGPLDKLASAKSPQQLAREELERRAATRKTAGK